MFLQYRGRITEEFQLTLKHLEVPWVVVSTMRKLRSVLPPLKPVVEKCLKSRVVYKITCSQCSSYYVGQTDHHVSTRFKEYIQRSRPIGILVCVGLNLILLIKMRCRFCRPQIAVFPFWRHWRRCGRETPKFYRGC